jgi:hypothetical protein
MQTYNKNFHTLNTKQLAEITPFVEGYICQLAREKRLPHAKVGKRYFFNREEALYAIERLEDGATYGPVDQDSEEGTLGLDSIGV